MSKTFKKGDTVRCLEDCDNQFTKNKLYIVRGDYYDCSPSDLVGVEHDDRGVQNAWGGRYFELATPWKGCVVTARGKAISWLSPSFYAYREDADLRAKELAEKYVGTEFAVYECVTSFIADKPVAREV